MAEHAARNLNTPSTIFGKLNTSDAILFSEKGHIYGLSTCFAVVQVSTRPDVGFVVLRTHVHGPRRLLPYSVSYWIDVRFPDEEEKPTFVVRRRAVRKFYSPVGGEKIHVHELLSQLFSLDR